jgi:hypothetical protein
MSVPVAIVGSKCCSERWEVAVDEELQSLLREIQKDPSNFAAWVAYVVALIRLGRIAEAEAVLDQIVARFGPGVVAELEAATGMELLIIEFGTTLEVILLFGAGLALPASKWGKLTLDDDADRDKWYALIIALYKRHIRERNGYREGNRTRSITELWADADYLWRLVQAFLRRYPDHESASLLRMIERAAGGWVDEYWRQDDAWSKPVSPPASAPLPQPQPKPAVPTPVEHPHTVERPMSYEDWLKEQAKADAQRKRERIARIRERIRELMRKRRDPAYNYEDVHKTIDRYIEELMEELQKLRDELTATGQDTGEEFDEPLDPLPPAPLPPWPLGHPARPYRLYVNPKTGEQDWFIDPPDRASGWEPASDYHWGWVPEVDPETGKIIWKPGWVLGAASEGAHAVHLMGGNPLRFETYAMLPPSGGAAQQAAAGTKRAANRKKS